MLKNIQIAENFTTITRNTLGYFWERTQLSGVSHAKAASSRLRATVWFAILILFTVFTAIGVYEVISDYLKRPVTTSVTLKYQNQVKILFNP